MTDSLDLLMMMGSTGGYEASEPKHCRVLSIRPGVLTTFPKNKLASPSTCASSSMFERCLPAVHSRGSAPASASRSLRASAVDSSARQRMLAARRSRSQASLLALSSTRTGSPPLSANCSSMPLDANVLKWLHIAVAPQASLQPSFASGVLRYASWRRRA